MSAKVTRRHYLVTYDISDDRRRREVFKTLEAFGDHAQFSVFICELNQRELVNLRSALRGAVHSREDQVLILDLGPAHVPLESGLEVVGRAYEVPSRTLVI